MNREEHQVLIWGAGKIGRGFAAEIFFKAGYGITFCVSRKELADNLKNQGSYTIHNVHGDGRREDLVISGYEVCHIEEKGFIIDKLAECEVVIISVFPAAIEPIAALVALGIEHRAAKGQTRPLNILLCINEVNVVYEFEKLLGKSLSSAGMEYLKHSVGLVETVVMRTVIEPAAGMKKHDPLSLLSNGYDEMSIDKKAYKGEIPDVEGLRGTWSIKAEAVRKIYTNNMVDALLAYAGNTKGYEHVFDSLKDPEIRAMADGALKEISLALHMEYGFSEEEMEHWNDTVLQYIGNPVVKDRVKRVGADPIRKLRREDRLTGPALLCLKHGITPHCLAKGIAYGFLFEAEGDEASRTIREYVSIHGIEAAIRKFCGLDNEPDLVGMIARYYRKR